AAQPGGRIGCRIMIGMRPVRLSRRAASVLALAALGWPTVPASQSRGDASMAPQELRRVWDAEHVSPPLPPLIDHAELVSRLSAVVTASPELFSMERIGESVEGRAIHHLRFGTGPTPVLLWSQMHGDEPTATAALFDVFEYVTRHRSDQAVARLLS